MVTKEKPKTKTKKKKWTRFRHKVITETVRVFMVPYMKLRYRIKIDKFREDKKRNYLILLNHQTPFDQFFVGAAFRGPLYYMATEDIFSMGWISKVIRWIIAPIPIKKQTTDVGAVMNCIKVIREGGSIAIAPEGNRTFSGKTEYMNPAIAPLARKLGVPVLLYRIEGGYGAEPRWSDVVRKGKMHGYVSRVIEPEEAAAMSNEELYAAIRDGLYVDEAVADCEFHHKELAQYLERCIFICPHCGIARFESHGDTLTCLNCGKTTKYLPTKEFQGDFGFRFVNDWYEYQKKYVNQLDTRQYLETPLFEDTANLFEVLVYDRKVPLQENMHMAMYGDRLVLGDEVLSFADISTITVCGKNKLNIYHGKKLYQIKGDKRFNALKYVMLFYRSKNIEKGDQNDEFLGI